MLMTRDNVIAMKDLAVWKLPDLLEREGIKPYQLYKKLEETHGTSPTTVYRWAKELPASLDVSLLMGVITALHDLTGKNFSVCDLLEYERKQ
jgi:Fe2+ or Zn2+ uptake regulation protein